MPNSESDPELSFDPEELSDKCSDDEDSDEEIKENEEISSDEDEDEESEEDVDNDDDEVEDQGTSESDSESLSESEFDTESISGSESAVASAFKHKEENYDDKEEIEDEGEEDEEENELEEEDEDEEEEEDEDEEENNIDDDEDDEDEEEEVEVDEQTKEKYQDRWDKYEDQDTICHNCLSHLQYCEFIECYECDIILCIPCFRLGAELGGHVRGHRYRVVMGFSRATLPGHWNNSDEIALIEAAQTYKLGHWNIPLGDKFDPEAEDADKKREQLCEYFDRFFIRGLIGKFALAEGFWMRDRHKYKAKGTLKKIFNDKEHTNPLIYNLYLAAMRWKKEITWRPKDPKLEQKIRKATLEYMNYEFNIEGRELLGCERDDYFFGGDLVLSKPILLDPVFAQREQQENEERRALTRELVQKELEEDRIKREQRDKEKKTKSEGETSTIVNSPTSGFDDQPCSSFSLRAGPSGLTNSSRKRVEFSDELEDTSPVNRGQPTSTSPSPLKIILKKVDGGKANSYVVAKNTMVDEKEDSPVNTKKRTAQRILSPESSSSDATRSNGQESDDDESPEPNRLSMDSSGDEYQTPTEGSTREGTDRMKDDSDETYNTPAKRTSRRGDDDITFKDSGEKRKKTKKAIEEDEQNETITDLDAENNNDRDDEEEYPDDEDYEPTAKAIRTANNPIHVKKQRRKKKIIKSKRLRRLEAFHKRENTKHRKREKALAKYSDLINIDQIREMRDSCYNLCLYRHFLPGSDRTKYRQDDLTILAYNPDRNEFEMESFNDAETMISELQMGPVSGFHEMTDVEQETKFARIHRYNRALHVRNARKSAINEHDKIAEFIDFMKAMTLEKRKFSEVLKDRAADEVAMNRMQQSVDKFEYAKFQEKWEKFVDLKEKIEKLQALQRDGVTSLKGVDLAPSRKKKVKKNSDALKRADARFKALQRQHIKMYAPEE